MLEYSNSKLQIEKQHYILKKRGALLDNLVLFYYLNSLYLHVESYLSVI